MDGVDQWASQAWPGFGEGVDGVHDAGVGGGVQLVDPVADLVRDVDLPVTVRHTDECTDRYT